jgi:hypothetical protein
VIARILLALTLTLSPLAGGGMQAWAQSEQRLDPAHVRDIASRIRQEVHTMLVEADAGIHGEIDINLDLNITRAEGVFLIRTVFVVRLSGKLLGSVSSEGPLATLPPATDRLWFSVAAAGAYGIAQLIDDSRKTTAKGEVT